MVRVAVIHMVIDIFNNIIQQTVDNYFLRISSRLIAELCRIFQYRRERARVKD